MSWEWLVGALPLLVLLAVCPIMMIWMMRGGRGEMSRNEDGKEAASGGADGAGAPETELAELRARLARLEAKRDRDRKEAGG